jgi:cytochrome b subunit of formate dehydrogenase
MMKNVLRENLARRVVHWLLVAVIVLYLLTGFSITEFRVVENVTFGLLSKNVAFYIHNNLLIPFIILLILHIYQGAKKSTKK